MQDILYVDDDRASRDILIRLLKHLKMNVDVAENATEALTFAGNKAYNLIVVDLALPDFDGWELLEKLKDIAIGEWVAVALTSYHDAGVARQAKQAGFADCFPKPANIETAQKMQSLIA